MEDDMELHENRTEVERLLATVWEYERRRRWKTSLPKWLFALTLSGTVLSAFAPSDVYTAVMTALAPVREKPSVDAVAAANVAEDLDYSIAQGAKSLVGWRVFLEAHPDGPHAQAAHAEIEGLLPTLSPQPIEVAEQSAPSPAAMQTLVEATQPPAPIARTPVMVEEEPAPPPVKIVEPPLATAPQPVMVMREPAPPSIPAFAPVVDAESAPLPPVKPREIAVAKSVEPAPRGHRRAEHHQASQPNVFTVFLAQLFHRHRQRPS
jgi:hypothetical protein